MKKTKMDRIRIIPNKYQERKIALRKVIHCPWKYNERSLAMCRKCKYYVGESKKYLYCKLITYKLKARDIIKIKKLSSKKFKEKEEKIKRKFDEQKSRITTEYNEKMKDLKNKKGVEKENG